MQRQLNWKKAVPAKATAPVPAAPVLAPLSAVAASSAAVPAAPLSVAILIKQKA